MVGFILMILGFLCVTVHAYIPSNHLHPAYMKTSEVGNMIQTFVIDNMLRGRLNYGVIIDLVGYALLFVGSALLVKYSKRFLRGMAFVLTTAALHVAFTMIPFYINGRQLTVTALSVSFFLLITQILMGYSILYGITEVTLAVHNEANVRYVKMGFIGASICRVTIYFLVLVGHNALSICYQAAMLGFMVFCLYNVCKLVDALPDYGKKGSSRKEMA